MTKKEKLARQQAYDKQYPELNYTVYTNWNEPKAVPGKPENDVKRDFGFTDNRIGLEGQGWVDAGFDRFGRMGTGVVGDQKKVYLDNNGVGKNVKTWNGAPVIEKSTGEDMIFDKK